jgi:hypothetical protein
MLDEKRLPEEMHGLGWSEPSDEPRRLLRPAPRNTSHFQQIDPDLDDDLMIELEGLVTRRRVNRAWEYRSPTEDEYLLDMANQQF